MTLLVFCPVSSLRCGTDPKTSREMLDKGHSVPYNATGCINPEEMDE
jgi:hypothetical protein